MRAFLIAGLLFSTAAGALPFGPFRTQAAPVTRDARARVRARAHWTSDDPMRFALAVYEATLSATDGPRCIHRPTCALYGVEAVRRHPLLGFALTVDRLWRSARSSTLRPLPHLWIGKRLRFYDPLDANDFWLRGIPDWKMPELEPPRPRQ